MEQFFRTGEAAKQLKITPHVMRRLCESGQIKSRLTATGRRLIAASEIAKYQGTGAPSVSVPADDPDTESERQFKSPKIPSPLIGSPSDEIVKSSESVLKARNNVEIRRAERELEEENDFFEERDRRQEEEQAAARARNAEMETQRRREAWMARWIDYALKNAPYDLPEEFKWDVRNEVETVLETVSMTYSESAIKSLIASATERAIRPWRRLKQKEEAIQHGVDALPWLARTAPWQQKVRTAANREIDRLPADSSLSEMKAAAQTAAGLITREYSHHQTCETFIRCLNLDLLNSSREEREDALAEVRQAVAVLPIGATQRQIQKAAEDALIPFNETVLARKQKKEYEHLSKLELIGIDTELGLEATWLERREAEEEVKNALAAMSVNSSQQQLHIARGTALAPFKEAITKRTEEKNRRDQENEKKRRIEIRMDGWGGYLAHVDDYLKELDEEYEIENRYLEAQKIKQKLRPLLLEKLMKQDKTLDEIHEFIEDFVEDELEI